MAKLTANPAVIVLDLDAGQSDGTTVVTYEKAMTDELWHQQSGGPWELIADPADLPGFDGQFAVYGGSYPAQLSLGDAYRVGIFRENRGPLGPRVQLLANLSVVAVGRRMRSDLILVEQGQTGGTWHSHVVRTREPTRVAVVAASRSGIPIGQDDFPEPTTFEGTTTFPATLMQSHRPVTTDLLAGNDYAYLVLVATPSGEWDYRVVDFTTLRRQLTVQFPRIIVFHDGDANTTGEAQFRFRVMNYAGAGQPELIEEFVTGELTVDDWSESGRPYPMGYAHIGSPQRVDELSNVVWVASLGTEDDSPWGSDGAWGRDQRLFFPSAEGAEEVTNSFVHIDCPPSTHESSFHYGVDVIWSVRYVL